jgi:hypothetical protein
MADPQRSEVLIRGLTLSGRPFRPSDWADRLAGVMSTFGLDSRINYSPYVHPLTADGVKCLAVDQRLERIDGQAWHFLMGFARDNDLVIEPPPDR